MVQSGCRGRRGRRLFLLLQIVASRPRACAAFALIGLCGLPHLFAWLRRHDKEPICDERDRLIHSRASLIAYSVFWVVFVLSCMVPYVLHPSEAIRVDALPSILVLGWTVLIASGSVATITQYRWGRQHAGG